MPNRPPGIAAPGPPHIRSGLILGIETSCDETAAAVVRYGTETLSSIVASQIDLHALYGGVVPELASREHLRNIVPVVRAAIAEAAKTHPGLTLAELDAVAVTSGPGLAGALLVGITYAKALAFALSKPLLAINHLEGHIFAVLMQHAADLLPPTNPPPPPSPFSSVMAGSIATEPPGTSFLPLSAAASKDFSPPPASLIALIVSGGHTHLYRATRTAASTLAYQTLGRTVDDAAGEAFDKVAKLLGLPYPGGPWIDALAPLGSPLAIPFRFSPIQHRGSPPNTPNLDFSFSGIKTAVLRHLEQHNLLSAAAHRRAAINQSARPTSERIADLRSAGLLPADLLDLAASFQHAVIGRLLHQTFAAVDQTQARALLVTGGVAANRELRQRFSAEAARRVLPIAFPTLALSTDNAAMIAAAAWPRLLAGDLAPNRVTADTTENLTDTLTAQPQLRLDTQPAPRPATPIS